MLLPTWASASGSQRASWTWGTPGFTALDELYNKELYEIHLTDEAQGALGVALSAFLKVQTELKLESTRLQDEMNEVLRNSGLALFKVQQQQPLREEAINASIMSIKEETDALLERSE